MQNRDQVRTEKLMTQQMSRRRALQGIGGALTAGVVLGVPGKRLVSDATSGTPMATGKREFVLTASEFDWELMPGMPVRAWGYNGQVPGPEIRVREGDQVRITLRNALPVPTTVHCHGVFLRPEMDGPAGLNQAPVLPGDEFVYEFEAKPSGTRWYHSHADSQLQVPMGLYGSLIIEPRVPVRPYTYDRDVTLILGEWDNDLTPEVAAGTAERSAKDQMMRGGELGADVFLLNGKAHGGVPPLKIREGERMLIRLINAGHMIHPIHIHGHSFKIVATDGNAVPIGMEWVKDTVLVGPGERYDLELVGEHPGVWMIHCHMEHHMANGMMTTLEYEGYKPTGPAADIVVPPAAPMPHDHHQTAAEATPEPVTAAATPEPGDGTPVDADAFVDKMVDDRFVPASFEIPAGTTVTWVNDGANMHSVAAYDGSFDSGSLDTGESFSHRFDTPGTFQFLCEHHALQGMLGKVVVTNPP
jgi:FtsP/CotA-like multicopper oxidase with cupredoxin domain